MLNYLNSFFYHGCAFVLFTWGFTPLWRFHNTIPAAICVGFSLLFIATTTTLIKKTDTSCAHLSPIENVVVYLLWFYIVLDALSLITVPEQFRTPFAIGALFIIWWLCMKGENISWKVKLIRQTLIFILSFSTILMIGKTAWDSSHLYLASKFYLEGGVITFDLRQFNWSLLMTLTSSPVATALGALLSTFAAMIHMTHDKEIAHTSPTYFWYALSCVIIPLAAGWIIALFRAGAHNQVTLLLVIILCWSPLQKLIILTCRKAIQAWA